MRRELAQAPFQICGTYATGGWQFIMLDSYDPGHVGGRLSAAGARTARRDPGPFARPRHGVLASSSGRHGQPLARQRSASPMRTNSGVSSMRTPTFARSPGATCIRPTRACAPACACLRRRRPARNSCRRASATRSTRARRPIGASAWLPTAASTARFAGWIRCACGRPRRAEHLPREPCGYGDGPPGVDPPGDGLLGDGLLGAGCWRCVFPAAPIPPQHSLWELHGKHNTVYLLGSIHVLRPSDYPLAPAVLDAYRDCELPVDGNQPRGSRWRANANGNARQRDVAGWPELAADHGAERAMRARRLWRARSASNLSMFDQFAPWFAAEAISQLQLAQLGFDARSGVEMYFLGRARTDGKSIAGLETVHEQIALFESLSMDAQVRVFDLEPRAGP